jgi:hypothetical protein
MKKTLRSFSILALLLLPAFSLSAQSSSGKKSGLTDKQSTYIMSLGLRGGYEGGLTFKYFFSPPKAMEILLSRGWGYGGFKLTGLYEIQKGLSPKGLDLYYGFGAHVGSYDGAYYGYYGYYGGGYYDRHGNWHPTGYRSHYTTIGIDGILGLEYQFTEFPLNVSLDIKPFIDLYDGAGHYLDGALSLRYVIK